VSSWPTGVGLALPRFARAEREAVLGGVCAGVAGELGVDPTLVRLAFAFLAFAGGAGVVAYAGAWLALPAADGSPPARRRRGAGLALLAIAAVLALRGLGLADSLVWPIALCAGGLILARRPGVRSGGLTAELGAGVALVVLGLVAFLRANAGGAGPPLVAPSGVAIALMLVLVPWAWRLARERDAERLVRIREQERAEMAARVHDSVLQTLALIQREAGDPRRVAGLARAQERELRASLHGYPHPSADSLVAALEATAGELEAQRGIRIEVVHTGDLPLDDRRRALVLAAREAMTNAATHAGVDELSVYVEAGEDGVSAYVRDRGCGFDPGAVPADRRGIAESIRGRMHRAGGRVEVRSSPDQGTEVELTLPGGGG